MLTAIRMTASIRGNKTQRDRRGAALVEFAVVAPLMFSTIFLFVEFDRYVFAVNAMEEAARTGCRAAIVNGAKADQVEVAIAEVLSAAGIGKYVVSVTPDLLEHQFVQGELVTITIKANYRDVSWLPAIRFLEGKTIRASATLPKEG